MFLLVLTLLNVLFASFYLHFPRGYRRFRYIGLASSGTSTGVAVAAVLSGCPTVTTVGGIVNANCHFKGASAVHQIT